jgi:hypothetical protein
VFLDGFVQGSESWTHPFGPLCGYPWDLILLSGGGNDLIDDADELLIPAEHRTGVDLQEPADYCDQGRIARLVADVQQGYRRLVAEVYRILTLGGIFMYPYDNRDPSKPGKLRLMYEANPMGFIAEDRAGISRISAGWLSVSVLGTRGKPTPREPLESRRADRPGSDFHRGRRR